MRRQSFFASSSEARSYEMKVTFLTCSTRSMYSASNRAIGEFWGCRAAALQHRTEMERTLPLPQLGLRDDGGEEDLDWRRGHNYS